MDFSAQMAMAVASSSAFPSRAVTCKGEQKDEVRRREEGDGREREGRTEARTVKGFPESMMFWGGEGRDMMRVERVKKKGVLESE
jgi:hypothetical protein